MEEKAALVVGAGGGGVGARPHEYENARRENSCHCLTQPTPTPCPAPSKRSLCLQLLREGGREGGRTASHAMACVSFSTTLPSSLPPPLSVCSSLLHHPTAPAVLTFTHLTFLSPEPGSGWPRARVLKNYMPNRNCMFSISNNKQGQQQ